MQLKKLKNNSTTFREAYKNATLEEIIKERDKLIREIRRYEKGKILEENYLMCHSPDTIYYCNNLYLAELCYLITQKSKEYEYDLDVNLD